ncbi:MAG TPA: ABC transporter permease [Acidimicrobiales bacterium]|nr:ABC transporter permease [Acidimicrobiales bacterium]
MPSFSYAWSELRRRLGRTLVTALGLAAGVGLVMGIIGVSEGLGAAQASVLSPLGSVGTGIIVTRTIAATTSTSASSGQASPSSGPPGGGPGFFARGVAGAAENRRSEATLLNNNASVLTDLAKLGKPGTRFTHDFFLPGTLITFPSVAVNDVRDLAGVTSAVGALSLQALHETGTVPRIVASVRTGGQTISTTVRPPALTRAQRAQQFACLESAGLFNAIRQVPPGPGGPSGRGVRRFFSISDLASNPKFAKCFSAAERAYIEKVVVPEQTIREVLNPPTTNTTTSSYTVAGVDPTSPGLVERAQLVSGHWFSSHPADEVLVDAAYASSHHLRAGQSVTINGRAFEIAGLVNPALTNDVADFYFDLATLQQLSSAKGFVNEILVSVASSSQVARVAAAIHKMLPGATVLTAKQLANQVSGSLANAHKLANDLGGALAVVVLLAAFLIAVLLTLSSVTKRVREIGSLRAIGWTRGAVVRQLMAENLGIGVVGGLLGLGIGALICAVIGAIGPGLSVTSTGLAVGASQVGSLVGQATTSTVTNVVHLSAPVRAGTIGLAFAGALVGGLVAGTAGGWRAARLAPAVAMRDLG